MANPGDVLAQLAPSILQYISEGVIIENAEGNCDLVNTAIATLLGYTPEELIGQPWTRLVAPEQQPIAQTIIERCRRGESARAELELVRRDGTRLLVRVASTPRYEQNQYAGAYTIFNDITEQRRTEQALHASQYHHHSVTQATRQLIYDYDVLTGQIYWTGAIQAVTGFTPEEFAHTDIHVWAALVHPDDRANALEQLQRAQDEHRPYHVEYRFRRKDDTFIWIEDWGMFWYNAAGQAYRMIGALRDITEHKRITDALRYREAILSAVAFATEILFRSSDWTEHIATILARLGQAAEVSRVYIFENYHAADGTLLARQRYEWVAAGITPQIDNPALQAFSYESGFARWMDRMQRRQPVYGLVRELPASERELLLAQDIRSIIIVPIYTGNHWWGFIGFDQCDYERIWSDAEIDALHIAANNLGSAIARSQTESILRASEERYRDLFEHSPAIIVLHDLQGRLLDANPAAVQTLGYSMDQLARMRIPDVLAPDVRHLFDDYITTLQQQGQTKGLMKVQTKSGAVRWLEYISTLRTTGVAAPVIRAMARDVTDLRHAQRQLRQRADEFAALYHIAQELTFVTDLHLLLQTIVTSATQLLHATAGAIFLYDATHHDLELGVTHNFPFSAPLRLKLGEEGSGYTAQIRQPVIVDDYRTWEHRAPQADTTRIRAAIYAPLIFRGELIGVLNLLELDDSTRKFTEEHARLLMLFATQAAAAVHNARLLQQTQQRAEQLALLYDAALTLNRALEPHQIIEHLLQIVGKSVHSQRTEFYQYDSATRTLTLASSGGQEDAIVTTLRAHTFIEGEPRGLVGLVAAQRTPLYLADVSADPRWIPLDPEIRSAFWVPVEREQHLFGVLVVMSTHLDAFSPAAQRLVTLFANQVAVALERALLFQAEQQRRAEISAQYALARALADTDTLDAICHLVVQHAMDTLPITSATLALVEGNTLCLYAHSPPSAQPTEPTNRRSLPLAHFPYCQSILNHNQPVVLQSNDARLNATERAWLNLPQAPILCLPLRAERQPLGLLLLAAPPAPESAPFTTELIHRARSIGDQAANAIRRARWHEQTEQRLRQVQALHTIDMTISASLDIHTTLQVLMPTLLSQLHADAMAILLFDPHTHLLTYLASQGFRTRAIEQTTLRVGKEYAGRAVLERKLMSESDLSAHQAQLQRHFLVTEEQFVSYVCAPLIAKGQVKGVLELFFRSPFTPTEEWRHLLDAFSAQTALALDNADLFRNLQRTSTELSLAYDAAIEGWAHTLEVCERMPHGHNARVADLTVRVARALNAPESQLRSLRYGALLHNLDTLFLPESLWHADHTPTLEEKALIQQQLQKMHNLFAARLTLRSLLDIPYHYHEHWDGSGWPRGLHGEQIPLGARIVAIADAWEHGIARSAQSPTQARQHMRDYINAHSGTRFDPNIVRVFWRILSTTDADTTPSPTSTPQRER